MKKLIVNLILVSLTLLVTVGFSAWYIIYNVELKPEKVTSSILKYFGASQEVIYNGVEQFPVQKSGFEIETLDPTTLTYSYKLKSDANYTVGKPINANVYDVLIKTNDGRECKVLFTIKPREITFKSTEIGLNFDSQVRQWSQIEPLVKQQIEFVDNIDKKTLVTNVEYNIDNITNGDQQYSSSDGTRNAKIYGSTYNVNISLLNLSKQNYKLIISSPLRFKYKTVLVNNVYYTIEDALIETNTGDIVLIGDATNSASYVVTSFSKILDTNTYDISRRRIHLPFDNGRTEDYVSLYSGPEASLVNVFSVLNIPEGITLNLNNGTNLAVGGVVLHQGYVKRRSVVMNNGTININSTSKLSSYGFTKGAGIINVSAGTEVIDVFNLVDWPGGKASLAFKNNGVFPLLKWSVHNITCATKVFKEGKYKAMTHINTAKIDFPIDNVYIIGDSNTVNCLFKPNGGLSSDYIIKSAVIPNDKVDMDSQGLTYLNKIEISGKYIDATMKITLHVPILGDYGFETSTSIAVPISNFDIILADKTELLFANSSYILYENTNILINKGAKLNIEANAYIFALNNSKITVCGELIGPGSVANKDPNGQLPSGSPIDALNSDAVINLSNYTVNQCKVKKIGTNETTIINNGITEGYIDSSTSIKQFQNGFGYQSIGQNPYYFVSLKDIKKFFIDLIVPGEKDPIKKTYQSINNTYSVSVNSLEKVRQIHYVFGGWYLDNTYNTPFVEHVFNVPNEKITLYAKMIPKVYNFSYLTYNKNGNTLEQVNATLSNQNPSFTRNDFDSNGKLKITTIASYQGKFFDGWYIGINKTDVPVSFVELDIRVLEGYLNAVGIDNNTIPLYCEFVDQITYNIILEKNNPPEQNETFQTTNDTIDLSVQTAKLTEYNSKLDHSQYFVGWFTSSGVEFISNQSSISELATNNNLVLHARWLNKACLTINHRSIGANSTNLEQKEFHIPGAKVDLSTYKYNDNYLGISNIYDSTGTVVNSNNYIQILNNNVSFDIEYEVEVVLEKTGKANFSFSINGVNKNPGTYRFILGTRIHVSMSNLRNGTATIKWCGTSKKFERIWSDGNISGDCDIVYTV